MSDHVGGDPLATRGQTLMATDVASALVSRGDRVEVAAMFADGREEMSGVLISLEPLRVEHADQMLSVLADPSLYEFTGGDPPSRDVLVARYRAQVAGSGRASERWCNWIVRRLDIGEPVGFVQATVVEGSADVAWLVGVAHQGQGLAVQAVRAMITELESSGVHHLTAQWTTTAKKPGATVPSEMGSSLQLARSRVSDDSRGAMAHCDRRTLPDPTAGSPHWRPTTPRCWRRPPRETRRRLALRLLPAVEDSRSRPSLACRRPHAT